MPTIITSSGKPWPWPSQTVLFFPTLLSEHFIYDIHQIILYLLTSLSSIEHTKNEDHILIILISTKFDKCYLYDVSNSELNQGEKFFLGASQHISWYLIGQNWVIGLPLSKSLVNGIIMIFLDQLCFTLRGWAYLPQGAVAVWVGWLQRTCGGVGVVELVA